MPRSKPFSASSFADSCPIPESDAVTMATGLIPSPLVRKAYPPGSMPPEWRAQTEYSPYESKSSVSTEARKSVRQRGLPQASLSQPLRIASSWASLSGESHLYLAIDRHPNAKRQHRCRHRRWPTRGRLRQKSPLALLLHTRVQGGARSGVRPVESEKVGRT